MDSGALAVDGPRSHYDVRILRRNGPCLAKRQVRRVDDTQPLRDVALIHLGKDAYGRAILNDVQTRLEREVSAGAVYATLERLEAKGLASSSLAPGTAIRGGRARRYFVPTGAGVRALNDAKRATESLWRGLAWPLKVRT
jgi:PadR family transcriptional regulator